MPVRLVSAIGAALVVLSASLILVGALGPWAQVVLFKNIDLSLTGVLFLSGEFCLAVAVLVLLGARRSPLLCLLGGLVVLGCAAQARRDVPRRVKHQVIGAQMALFPINRLLDQFHINDIEVGGWSGSDDSLLGPGLTWTAWGGALLLLGGGLGLPRDPLVVWTYAHAARRRCRSCGTRWPADRGAEFCPECGAAVLDGHRRCAVCRNEALPGDCHCIACGSALPD